MANFTNTRPSPDDVVISGIGGTFPQCDNLEEFERNLLNNTHLVDEIPDPNWHTDVFAVPCNQGAVREKNKFDSAFFGISENHTHKMDPITWRIMEKSFEAVIDSGFSPRELRNSNTAVIMGSFVTESESLWLYRGSVDAGYSVMGHNRSMLANRVSYWLNTKGTSYSFMSEEAAGIRGLEIARELISTKQCDGAIVGTVNLTGLPEVMYSYMGLECLSRDGKCRAFDDKGEGSWKSDACVVMYLQRAKDAKRTYATVVEAQTSYCGARDAGFIRPVGDCLAQFLERFYKKCGVDPAELEYLEASSCGLKVYEEAEFEAVSKVLLSRRKSPLLIGCVKSNMGQAGPSSSLCSVAKLVIAMEKGVIPANLHYETPAPHIPALVEGKLQVVAENTKWSPGLAAVNSVELTGLCGHVLLRPYARAKLDEGGVPDELPRIICLSGRTDEGTKKAAEKVKAMATDAEFVRLVQDVFSSNITNHNYRAYIVSPSSSDIQETQYFDGSKRPVWFVFSGMGSQWPGMGTHLMKLPIIADTIHKCHSILQPTGVDLINILTSEDPCIFDNILHSFVGIAAVQLALVETLRLLNIEPDGIIGHSVGELGCAYADGCFTMEQMILAAYYRGLASLEAELIEGRMAAVGMDYKSIKDILPSSIDVACHNSEDSSTISGPAEAVTQFVNELKAQYIFAREVNVSDIAYHSRYIKPAAPKLLAYLRNVIPEPMRRSSRWHSTSAPEESWDTDEARYSSAEYHTNNLLNPVLFEETSRHIPKNAILIEIAPHGLLQAILKRSMGADCVNVPLTQRGNQHGVEFLLSAVGKLYLAGVVPRISALYPPVLLPVSRGTPYVSSLTSWDHSKTWDIMNSFDQRKAMNREIQFSLRNEDYRIFKDYVVNGEIILPVAAVLVLVWKELGNSFSRNFKNMPVVFDSTYLYYTPVFPDNGTLVMTLFLQEASGNFEIFEEGKDEMFAKGQVRTLENASAEFSSDTVLDVADGERMTLHEFYNELQLRGVQYGEQFRTIRETILCDQGSKSLVDWSNNWIVDIDSLLQLAVLQSKDFEQHIHVPVFIQKMVVDPLKQTTHATNAKVATFHKFTNTVHCENIEIRGIKTKKLQLAKPLNVTVSSISFIPFKKTQFQDQSDFINRAMKLSTENISALSKSFVSLMALVNGIMGNKIVQNVEQVLKKSKGIKAQLETYDVSENKNMGEATFRSVFLADDSTVQQGVMLLKNFGGFLLASLSLDNNLKLPKDVAVIDEQCFESNRWIFMTKCVAVSKNASVAYLSKTKDMKLTEIFSEGTSHKYFISETSSLEEVKAFVADICTGKMFLFRSCRLVFIVDGSAPPFSVTNPFYADQLSLDLLINIYYNGSWGALVDLPVPFASHTAHTRTAFSNLVSSLRVEGFDWSHIGVNFQNFRATRRQNILNEQDMCVDVSGSTVDGQKVMCVARVNQGCVQARTAPRLTWSVPDNWSYEDAATVPFAYATAYYALILKANARRGENILIHAGHTPLGQAFISVALQNGLDVTTTVSNNRHVRYLRRRFPQILNHDIYDMNVKVLEKELMKKTKNKGFRIVVNSLGERFLHMSVNVSSLFGRLLQFPTTEMEQNKDFGMEPFLKNLALISILPEMMFDMNSQWRTRLHKMLADGILKGVVQPFDREVFTVADETEILSTLNDFESTKKLLVVKDSYFKQHTTSNSRMLSKDTSSKTVFSFDSETSCLIFGDAPESCLPFAKWLVSRGSCHITMCCDTVAMSALTSRHIQSLRLQRNVCVDIVSVEKFSIFEKTVSFLHGLHNVAPLSAIVILSLENPLFTYVLELALCDTELRTPTVIMMNSDISTVQHMRKSTGLPVLDVQLSSEMKGSQQQALFKILDALLLSNSCDRVYVTIEHKGAVKESHSSEEQLATLLPSSLEQLELLGEDLALNTSCSLKEVNTKCPRLLHVREVLPVFIIPGLQGPAESTAEVLAHNLMCPAFVVKLPGGADNLRDNVAALVPAIKRIQPKGPYNLVGISWGGMYTIEVAKQLQAEGAKTQVFLLEGAPQTNQDIARLLGDGDQLQMNLLVRLLNLPPNSLYKSLPSPSDWSSRVQRALLELPEQTSVVNKHYLSIAVESVYSKLQTLLHYRPDGVLLTGQVVLIRPKTKSPDLCGLEKFFKESLNVVSVDSAHRTLLGSLEVANVISDLVLVDLYWVRHQH